MKKIFWRWLFWTGMMVGAIWHLNGQAAASFQYLSKKDGLSQASVFAIAQDSAGFMWFGTRNGLNKFDGYQFKVYKKDSSDHSLVADDIRHLYSDPLTHHLWIGTISGLGRYQPGTDRFTNYLNSSTDSTSLTDNVIRQIFRDSKGRLWVGTSNGLNLYQSESDNFKRIYLKNPADKSMVSKEVKAIFEDSDQQLWLGTSDGLYRLLEEDSPEFARIDNSEKLQLSGTHIKNIVEDHKNNFWIGTEESGLNYWDRLTGKVTVYQSDRNGDHKLSHNSVRAMVMDPNGHLWVGTFDGLNYLAKDKTTFKVFKKEAFQNTGLSDQSIHSLFVDRSKGLWIGTYYGGVNHWVENYNQFVNYQHIPNENSLSGNVVSSFAEDEKGNLWIGTEGRGLNYFDKKEMQFKVFQHQADQKNTLSGNSIKKLLLDKDQLWIGTFQAGLNLMDVNNKNFKQYKKDPLSKNSISSNNVYGLHKVENLLWILTYGNGLDILDLSTDKFYNFSNNKQDSTTISSNLVRVILETRGKDIWIGTEAGLSQVSRDKMGFPVKFKNYFPKEKIYSLQESYNQKIWVGTFNNGLYLFDPRDGSTEQFTTANGLSGNSIFGILESSDQEVWLSTNNGLTRYNIREKSFTNYDYSHGLANLEHNFNAYYKTREGHLLFGGLAGFTELNPRSIKPNEYLPPVVFTELRQNNKVIRAGENNTLENGINQAESIQFNYNEANFSIRFAALDYFSPENNRYAYQLEGVDKDWNYTVGKTEVTYGIQREGTYTFRLRGANSDGVWNPQERRLAIKVLPPVYRTWWAYGLYLLALCLSIFGLVRFIRLQHKLQLEQIAKQKQKELHEMKLRFFTNITHEFRTPLTLILGPVKDLLTKQKLKPEVNNQLSLIEKNTQRLLNLVNQLITFRKLATDHEPMKIKEEDIVHFLKEIFLSFQELARMKNIDYRFEPATETLRVWYDQDKLEKVFFNLLSNAFKFTPDGGQISMQVSQVNGLINVIVKDNGVGVAAELKDQIFKRFYEKNTAQTSSIKGSGIGLAISKQMVELHGGEIKLLPNSAETPNGAIFLVQIPVEKLPLYYDQSIEKLPVLSVKETLINVPVVQAAKDNVPAPSDNMEEKNQEGKLPLLLIVEDNPDIRSYIQQIFVRDYRFLMAENGLEGLTRAKEGMPDLIISDVMMPVMDGITLSGKLKADLETSHIPIILLTARTATLFKIEGLQTGVDDYLTKPFDPEELRLKVRNIVRTREAIKEKFVRVLNFDPKEINVTSADEKLLHKAMEVVEKNIGNYEFNVNQFATELAVSRPLLFTKLKALTGQTPNNFVKTIRLKRAAQLLETQKLNVSEIAYKVGFKDPKYFRKCFKEQFKISPSAYKK